MLSFGEKTMSVLKRIREDSLQEDASEAYPEGRRLHAIPFESGWFFYALARSLKPKRALEIGMSAGMSTIFIAKALNDSVKSIGIRQQSLDENSEKSEVTGETTAIQPSIKELPRLYTMEYDKRMLALGRKNLEEVGLGDWVEIIEGDAKENVKTLEGTFEFIFNDAEKVDYLYFVKELERVTEVGSVMISDNAISHKEMLRDFFSYLADSEKWFSQTIPIGNGLEMSLRVR